jgi:cytochrome c biogenesis protein CcmG/thiol:disulfide interchange protein DsbE
MRLRFAIPLALFVAVAAGLFAGLWLKPEQLPSPLIDKPMPPITLKPIEGLPDVPGFATADLDGRVTILNVFASWCIPCRAEHPELKKLIADPAFKGRVGLIGINYKDKPKDALAYLDELGNPYQRIGADTTGRASIDLGVYGVPETFLIDAKGRIRLRYPAPMNPYDVEHTIKPALKKIIAEAGNAEARK